MDLYLHYIFLSQRDTVKKAVAQFWRSWSIKNIALQRTYTLRGSFYWLLQFIGPDFIGCLLVRCLCNNYFTERAKVENQ